MYDDFEKYARVPEEYAEPEEKVYVPRVDHLPHLENTRQEQEIVCGILRTLYWVNPAGNIAVFERRASMSCQANAWHTSTLLVSP